MRHHLICRGIQFVNTCFDLLGGPLYELLGYGVSRSELEAFFGVPLEQSRKLAWASAAVCCKNWNQQRFVRRFGLESIIDLIRWENSPEDLVNHYREQRPLLLVTWHSGPLYSVPAALFGSGLDTLCCVGPPPPFKAPEGLTYVPTEGDGLRRTDALHRALKRLREGGFVYLVADHPNYSQTRAPICGRMASFSPSISMLSKVSKARVVPIIARWDHAGRIVIRHGSSIDSPDSEVLLERLAFWFENYFLEHPYALEPKYLMKLMFSPEAEG